MKGRALFSLYDTSRAVEFAEQLIKSDWEIIGSDETVKVLKANNIPEQEIQFELGSSIFLHISRCFCYQ